MLKTNMGRHEDGFTGVEVLVTLLVSGIFVLAFTQLYGITRLLAQDALEDGYAVSLGVAYLDQARYYPNASGSGSFGHQFPGTPYTTTVDYTGSNIITPTLNRTDIHVEYGYPVGSKTLDMSAYIRYGGGLYYAK